MQRGTAAVLPYLWREAGALRHVHAEGLVAGALAYLVQHGQALRGGVDHGGSLPQGAEDAQEGSRPSPVNARTFVIEGLLAGRRCDGARKSGARWCLCSGSGGCMSDGAALGAKPHLHIAAGPSLAPTVPVYLCLSTVMDTRLLPTHLRKRTHTDPRGTPVPHLHVAHARLRRQLRELVEVRGEQRGRAAVGAGQVLGDGPGQAEAVVGGGAAAQLVDDDQRVGRGALGRTRAENTQASRRRAASWRGGGGGTGPYLKGTVPAGSLRSLNSLRRNGMRKADNAQRPDPLPSGWPQGVAAVYTALVPWRRTAHQRPCLQSNTS